MEEQIKEVEKNVEMIVNKEIFTLNYFNNANFLENKKSLKKVLLDEPLHYQDAILYALYWAEKNTLYIHDQSFEAELLLHETIHFLSADRAKNMIGYAQNEDLFMFNEAATQWLTVKVIYGDDVANRPSLLYGNEVKLFDQLVTLIGEEKMFCGFFEADFDKLKNNLNEKENLALDNVIGELRLEAQKSL